jgi:hypothetical protein
LHACVKFPCITSLSEHRHTKHSPNEVQLQCTYLITAVGRDVQIWCAELQLVLRFLNLLRFRCFQMSHVRVWWTDTFRSHGCFWHAWFTETCLHTDLHVEGIHIGCDKGLSRIQVPVLSTDCHFLYRNVRCGLRKDTSHMYQLKLHNSHDTQQAYSHIWCTCAKHWSHLFTSIPIYLLLTRRPLESSASRSL